MPYVSAISGIFNADMAAHRAPEVQCPAVIAPYIIKRYEIPNQVRDDDTYLDRYRLRHYQIACRPQLLRTAATIFSTKIKSGSRGPTHYYG